MIDDSDDAAKGWTSRLKQRRVSIPLAAVLLVAIVVSVVLALRPNETPAARPAATASPTPTPSPTAASRCKDQATEPFKPTRMTVPGIVRHARVLALPRDANDIPAVPPVSGPGRLAVAWDRPPGIKPGSSEGNVLMNTHTFPDGSALGNKFLDELDKGDLIVVHGKNTEACYEVRKRIEVLASDGYPPYYDDDGPPQLALIVCSGKRLGPGNWTHRTIWFAKPA